MLPTSIRLYPSVLTADTGMIMSLEGKVQNWRRSIRALGGPWQGSFTLEGDLAELQAFFYRYLGAHLEEREGRVTWDGLVYEMELTAAGVTRRRSLEKLSNRVQASYTDTSGNEQTTAWASNSYSTTRYGQKDEIITLSGGQYAAATAQGYRDTYLAEREWPWARSTSIRNDDSPARLVVSVCGYIFTANWRYVTAADDGTGNIDAWISDILSTDCEFLSEGALDANTLQVKRTLANDKRAWELMKELTGLGDGTDPWRLYANPGRTVRYEKIDTDPRYYLRRGGVYTRVGNREVANPWLVQPGVFRDAEYPVRRSEGGAPWLSDVRDIWVEEVEVGQESGLQLKPGDDYSDAELMAAVQEYGATPGPPPTEPGRL
jgi:hypothetical protein